MLNNSGHPDPFLPQCVRNPQLVSRLPDNLPRPMNISTSSMTTSTSSTVAMSNMLSSSITRPTTEREIEMVKAERLKKAVERIKVDHTKLSGKINELAPIYGDQNLQGHIRHIEEILTKAMNEVIQRVEVTSRPMWQEATKSLLANVNSYATHLENSSGRKSFKELQELLEQCKCLLDFIEEGKDVVTCCICTERNIDTFLGCGHFLCSTCAQSVNHCPLCRHVLRPEELRPAYL